VSVELFRDDDQGYAAWLAANVQGHVLNIRRSLNPSDARVHEADCRTITGTPTHGRTWTAPRPRIWKRQDCGPDFRDLQAVTCHVLSPGDQRETWCCWPQVAIELLDAETGELITRTAS